MTKTDLLKRIAQEAGLTHAKALSTLDATLSAIQQALAAGEEVTLAGFGRLSVFKRAARQGRNPQTGETIPVPARKVPRFKPGKELKEAVK